MADFQNTLSGIETIINTNDENEIFCELAKQGRQYGFEYVLMGRLSPDLTSTSDSSFYKSTFPENWHATYVEKNYVLIDPIIEYVKKYTLSVRLADSLIDLTDSQKAFTKDAMEHGIFDGFIVPINVPKYYVASVIFTSKSKVELDDMAGICLEMVARISFQRIALTYSPIKNVDTIKITDRERQILNLVSKGKTNWEVGKILDISEFSVRDYLANLSQRLETCNRTHTVTRALHLGLISL